MKKTLITFLVSLITLLTISVSAQELPGFQIFANSSEIYEDVAKDSWYKESIDGVVSLGIMNGTSETKFAPDEDTSRGALVTILWRMTGNPLSDAELPFTDLTEDWYENAVKWAYASGVVNGTGATVFSPDDSISREALATVLYRYLSYMNGDTRIPASQFNFSDMEKVSSWAKDAVEWAVANGIISGSNGALLPTKSATRAEIATIIMRFCEKYKSIFPTEDNPDENEKYKDIPFQLSVSYIRKYYAAENSNFALNLGQPKEWVFVQNDKGGSDIVRDGKVVGRMIAHKADDLDIWKTIDSKSKEEGIFKVSQFIEKYGTGITLNFRYRYVYEYVENGKDMVLTLILDPTQVSSAWETRLYDGPVFDQIKTTPVDGVLSSLRGKNIAIAGNSFIGSSNVGEILQNIIDVNNKSLSVDHWSTGFARISTYLKNGEFINRLRRGEYDAVFICGLYGDGDELDALDTLYSECKKSNTRLILFPAHNESIDLVRKAKNLFPQLVVIDWKSEVEALITSGVSTWDMCIKDEHRHSTSLAGYVGAHMIYRAIFGENPKEYPTIYVTKTEVEEKLGDYIESTALSIIKEENITRIK